MTVQDYIKSQLAMLAWWEGHRRGGVNNMLAVAFVVRNRVRSGWLGGDWMKLIANHFRWSAGDFVPNMSVLDALDDAEVEVPDFHDAALRRMLEEIDGIFDGSTPDNMTEGALYYAELNRVDPEFNDNWFKLNILDNLSEHKRVATVGVVSFFM